jgi:hypothetical protein
MVRAMWGQARSRVVDVLLGALLVLLTVAPVFVKQHLILDAALAVPWALAAHWIAGKAYGPVCTSLHTLVQRVSHAR